MEPIATKLFFDLTFAMNSRKLSTLFTDKTFGKNTVAGLVDCSIAIDVAQGSEMSHCHTWTRVFSEAARTRRALPAEALQSIREAGAFSKSVKT